MRIFNNSGDTKNESNSLGGTMKKIIAFLTVLSLTCALAACGRRMDTPETNASTGSPTTAPSPRPTAEPTILPTMETNIPDPSVDTSMSTENSEATMGNPARSTK